MYRRRNDIKFNLLCKKVKLNERFEKCNRFRKGISLFLLLFWKLNRYYKLALWTTLFCYPRLWGWSEAFILEGGFEAGNIFPIIRGIQKRWYEKCFNYYLIVHCCSLCFNDFGASFFKCQISVAIFIRLPASPHRISRV